MKRALVTGASGFIGRHAVPALLARGFEVQTLGRTALPGVPHHRADLLEPAETARAVRNAGATHLLHLAWFVEPGAYWSSPRNLDWVAASLHLVRAFGDAGGTRLVGCGSCAEYRWGGDVPLNEDESPCRPATLYGSSKDALRRLLLAQAASGGPAAAWGRVFFLYGPGERPERLVAGAVATLGAGGRFPTSHGRQRRDFLHVADAAAAFAALLDGRVEGAVNIGSGRAVPVRTVLGTVHALLGGAGTIGFGDRPLADTEPAVIEAAVDRLTREVGFTPRFTLDTGLADTVGAARGYTTST